MIPPLPSSYPVFTSHPLLSMPFLEFGMKKTVLYLVILSCSLLNACGGDGGSGDPAVTNDQSSAVTNYRSSVITSQAFLTVGDTNCPTGGAALDYGIDTNGNGVLDTDEINGTDYICNGENGTDGQSALIVTTELSPGDTNCPNGGQKVESGLDANGDGLLNEVASTSYICNGINGTNGIDGQTTLVNTTPLGLGDTNCPDGGQKIESGLDVNGDGSLAPEEVTAPRYVCNGADGLNTLLNISTVPVGDANCSKGGQKVESVLDLTGDGITADDTIIATNFICNQQYQPLTVTSVSSTQLDLDWSGMGTDPQIAYYDLYMDRNYYAYINDGTISSYQATGLTPFSLHCFMVVGLDSLYNVVDQTPEVCSATGGHYWETTTTVNAPSPRFIHTATWTGDKMIVWGGYDGNNYVNTGGIYDPATDTWAPIDTTGAPTTRFNHTAVWTGDKMIVWGGFDGAAAVNTGGIYDPASDSWSPIDTTGAPSARRLHTAVWTGDKMIVWGGYDGSSINTGGIYDPTNNEWSAISAVNAPSARYHHGTVWTGNEMIVWGGSANGTNFNSGGIYDPTNDIWSSTSSAYSPSARYAPSAVWTGSSMIIWGGNSTSGYQNTGGIMPFN